MSRFGDYMHNLWHVLHPGQDCGEGSMQVITDVALQRQMLYDAFADPEAAGALVGLPAISDDVAEMEHRAHHDRLEAIVPVMPLLLGQATFMGHAAAVLQLHNTCGEDELEDTQVEAVHLAFTNIIKAAVISSVSTAVGLGALQVSKEVTTDD